MKRVTWFATGVVAGAGAVVVAGRRIRARVAELAPVRVAERAVERTRGSFERVKEAIGDGRHAMAERESELRRRLLKEDMPSPEGEIRPVRNRR